MHHQLGGGRSPGATDNLMRYRFHITDDRTSPADGTASKATGLDAHDSE